MNRRNNVRRSARNVRSASSRSRVASSGAMSRGRFLRTAGMGAMGVAGAAMMGSGLVSGQAYPSMGAKVLVVVRQGYRSDPGSDDWNQITDQAIHVLEEAGYANLDYFPSSVKGYKVLDIWQYVKMHPPTKKQAPTYVYPGQFYDAWKTKEAVASVWGSGYDAIIAATASSQATGIEDFLATLPSPVPHIQAWAVSSSINTAYDNLFLRTTVTGVLAGVASANETRTIAPSGSRKAFIKRANDPFGDDVLGGWESVLGPTDAVIVMDSTGTTFTVNGVQDDSLSVFNTGTWLVGSALATTNSVNVVKALSNHANGANLYLGMVGSVSNEDYSKYEDWLYSNTLGILVWFDEASKGFAHWQGWSGIISVYAEIALRMADGARLMVNTLEGGLRGEALYYKIIDISRSPGTPFYVNDLIPLANLDYQGASGAVDFDDYGEITSAIFKIWSGMREGETFSA